MLKKMRMEKRLTVSFLIVAFLATLAALMGILVIIYTSNQYQYALTNYGFSQGDIGNTMVAFSETRSSTRAIIGYTDDTTIQEALTDHDKSKSSFAASFSDIEPSLTTDDEKNIYNEIKNSLDAYWKTDSEIIEMGNTTDQKLSKAAQTQAAEVLDPKFEALYDQLTALMESNITNGDLLETHLDNLSKILIFVIIVMILAALAVSLGFSRYIARGVAKPLNSLSLRLESFAQGDLKTPFPEVDTRDEVGDMVAIASDMAENLELLLKDYGTCVDEAAKGNFMLKSSMPERYVGDFKMLQNALDSLIGNLRETLLQIGEASKQVDFGSQQLAENAQSLAEGATEQAGAVEELTATVENVAAETEHSAAQAEHAYQEAIGYREQAESGSRDMEALVGAMNRISAASKEIENIISEIEDIASQTNLLSLNASIEAARAGEAGKGFAVVADQIGKLATDSAQSAVRTRDLIQNALSEVAAGNQMTEQTQQALAHVVDGIEHLSSTTKELSSKSLTQVSTMQEIAKGIEQISNVVQSNSAAAQENSATSEELAAQAQNLQSMISKFILN